MRRTKAVAVCILLASVGAVQADEPRPVPLTRPEMKQFLEDMKARKPRIPLPQLSAGEKENLGERGGGIDQLYDKPRVVRPNHRGCGTSGR